MGTFIVFGQKANVQTEGVAGQMQQLQPMGTAFGIVVEESPETVAGGLTQAGPIQLRRVWSGKRHEVYVNPANVLYIQEQEIREEG